MKNLRNTYCKVCQNRKNDHYKGIVCGLTNKTPDFEGNCMDYLFNEGYLENEIDNKRVFYEKILSKEDSNEKNGFEYSSTRLNNDLIIPERIIRNERIEIKESLLHRILTLVIVFIALYFVLMSERIDSQIKIALSIGLLVFSIIWTYLKILNAKPILIFSSEGLKLRNNQFIAWSDIIYTSFQRTWESDQRNSKNELVIDCLSGQEKMKIGLLEVNDKIIGHLVEKYKIKYKRRK